MSDKWIVNNVKDFLSKIEPYALRIKANGNARGFVMIFYDLYCPGCALMDLDLMDYLLELSRRGMVDLFFVDYPVHKVDKLHAKIRILYKRNPEEFIKRLSKIYSDMVERGVLVKDIEGVDDEEAEPELKAVSECKRIAKTINVVGTPTILAARYDRDTGVALFGYDGPDSVMNLIKYAILEF